MKTVTMTLKWGDLSKDMQANTYKLGFINPREDGREGETQISADEALDKLITKRNTLEAISDLLTRTKRFTPTIAPTLGTSPSDITDPNTSAVPAVIGTIWTITANVTDRNDATAPQASNLAHSFVVSYVCAEWYRLINAETMKVWETRKEEAITKLLAALYHKSAPVLS